MQQNKRRAIFGIIAFFVLLVCGIIVWKLQLWDAQLKTQHSAAFSRPLMNEEKVAPPLVDGEKIDWLGVFRDSPVVNGLKLFHSDALGISFKYPEDYFLFENEGGEGLGAFHNIQIVLKKPILQTVARQQSGVPPFISLTFYLRSGSLSLDTWMREDNSHSNFHVSDPSNNLTLTTVAGLPAFRYHSSIINNNDYVAFQYDKWMVLAATAVESKMESDFQVVLSSLILQNK